MAQSTEQFAARNFVKPQSVVTRLCRFGHYFGVRPDKLPNGRLAWPDPEPGCSAQPEQRSARA